MIEKALNFYFHIFAAQQESKFSLIREDNINSELDILQLVE